ncbi:LysR family transcriptional regulator ArgP [Spirilliplanes yamanashiensis]|uniref:HTH-type transcriptional regulator LysG n=1 Tax=Spirilliplanes yamanashiensis TaxID=42233 RepID=A0A8J3Y3L3_9ACTN|nr:LysR family transcriptional regulator ArgP [Spirilliplanes yamanashiensis]MDP9814040.1 LysR family transcriptional regulator (chromosome initiation inhibitor) [Spirilliplanes yamanashiensis]GIJ00980.1 putative transcriptional regulator, LysR family protein [Spirilliplanes yamanashiensis]
MSLDPVQLATFQAVVEHGSFEAAARALHVTPSAVSQRVKALEQVVGQVLVRRAKPCVPTDAGRPLIRLTGQVALLEREALEQARGSFTRVAVVVNADSLATWFLPALVRLPEVTFELHTDDEGHTADLLRDGTVMAAVTAEQAAVQGCRVEPLGVLRYVAAATPELHAAHFAGRAAGAAFGAAPMLRFNRKDLLQHRFARAVTRRDVDPPTHFVPASAGFIDAVRLGLGWGLVPDWIAAPDVAAGRLVDLAPGRHLDVPLYWQYWRLESAVLARLTAAVRAAAAGVLR